MPDTHLDAVGPICPFRGRVVFLFFLFFEAVLVFMEVEKRGDKASREENRKIEKNTAKMYLKVDADIH